MLELFDSEPHNTMSSYTSYPELKPFINTDWTRATQITSKAFPESNRDLIMNTLKKLQKKLNKIEVERNSEGSSGKVDLGIHSRSTISKSSSDSNAEIPAVAAMNVYSAYPLIDLPARGTNSIDNYLSPDYERKSDDKVASTEKRVIELEKQLEKMRRLLNEDTIDKDRKSNNLSRLNRYTNNNIAKTAYRRSMNFESDTTLLDVESAFSTSEESSPVQMRVKKSTSNKQTSKTRKSYIEPTTTTSKKQIQFSKNLETPKKSIKTRSISADTATTLKAHQHYRLKLGELPFCVGQSTTPSHNLASNIQNVISLLKQHHPKLCGSLNDKQPNLSTSSNNLNNGQWSKNSTPRRSVLVCNEQRPARSTSTPNSKLKYKQPQAKAKKPVRRTSRQNLSMVAHQDSLSSDEDNEDFLKKENIDWNELLRVLQEEYTKLVLQHYDLTKKIMKCTDGAKRNEYELRASNLNKKMKAKAKQINRLKIIQKDQKTTTPNKKLSEEIQEQENEFLGTSRTNESEKRHSYRSSHLNNSGATYTKLNKSTLNSSNTSLYNENTGSTNGFNTLQLFKDIKNLQQKIQNDLDY